MADVHADMIRRARAQIDALGSSSPSSQAVRPAALPDIPNYEIIREIQRGGQGAVYLCRQLSTRREVALKLLHARDGGRPAERQRFQREVEILAALRHPNVVTIHDSGSIGDRFYYAMEYIAGRPLDKYLAEVAPPIRERVRLFAEISAGVGAAHLRGVIHRDLKPGNIRVDDQGRCHVLDFGLARFADDGSDAFTASGAMTQTGQFLGSLPWASPEQVAGQRDELDLRTDVYSLGVLLYQGLTGGFPYRVTGSLSEVVEKIRTVEPVAPSKLTRGLNDELDTIVLKCLAKDRERRYSTAVELASDLKRYLVGEPIEAKRDSLGYLLRRQLRKHWLAASVATFFVLTVTGSLIATLSFWSRAVADRARALAAQDEAETESAKAKAVLNFLNEEILGAADPETMPAGQLTVGDALNAASDALATQTPGDPLVAAEIRSAIGQAYRSLGVYDRAEEHLVKALETLEAAVGPTHPDTIEVVDRLAYLRGAQGLYEEEERLHRRVYESFVGALGPDDPETLLAMNGLSVALNHLGRYDEAATMLQRAYEGYTRARGEVDRDAVAMRLNLAGILDELGRTDDARRMYDGLIEAFEQAWGPEHPHTLAVMNNYATFLRDSGDTKTAEPIYKRSIEIKRRVLGPTHPLTLASLGNLASLYSSEERPEAEALQREVLEGMKINPGPDHPNTLVTQTNLAGTLRDLGQVDEAEAMYRDVIERHRRVLDGNHIHRSFPIRHLATMLVKLGRHADAEPLQRELIAIYRASLEPGDERYLTAISNLATVYAALERYDEAEPLRREALEWSLRHRGADDAMTRTAKNNLAVLIRKAGRPAEAAELFTELTATLAEGDVSADAALWRSGLGACLADMGRFDEAEGHLLFALSVFERRAAAGESDDPSPGSVGRKLPESDALISATRERLAILYEAWGKPERAEFYRSSP